MGRLKIISSKECFNYKREVWLNDVTKHQGDLKHQKKMQKGSTKKP